MDWRNLWAARLRRARGMEVVVLGFRKAAPRKHKERIGLLCLIDLVQDADLILPVAMAAAQSGRFEVRLVVTDWLDRIAPGVVQRITASGLACERYSRDTVLAGLAPDLGAWDAVLTASETSAAAHRFAHALVQRANELGLSTFTLQHGLENVGLTYRGDGDYLIRSQWIFTWNAPSTLPGWLDDETRSRCIGVGRLAKPQATTEPAHNVVAVFENLHWTRYDDSYRERFIADLRTAARARPDLRFIVRPHPAGLFALGPAFADLSERNIVVASPHAEEGLHASTADLLASARFIITTPSTIALDAAMLGRSPAVVGYDLALPAYEGLPLLREESDWLRFLDGALTGDADEFKRAHVLEGDARDRIVQAMLVRARTRGVRRASPESTSAYAKWVTDYDTLSDADRTAIRAQSAVWPALATVIIDARSASSAQIQTSERSIARQLIGPVATIVSRQALAGSLAVVTTPYVAIVEAGDVLSEHALHVLLLELRARPGALFAYSDEDKMSRDGRVAPHFKPDWDPYRFRTQDYCCRLALMDTAAARAAANEAEAQSVWELLLRMTEAAPERSVLHAPYALYHRRADAAPRTIARWDVAPAPAPLVSLIVPTRDRLPLLRACIAGLRATSYPACEIIVVDNGSVAPETLDYLRALAESGDAKVLRDDGAFNFSRLNNTAASTASGPLLALVNNDVVPADPDWLTHMVSLAVRADVGAVGAMLTRPDGTIQHAGCVLGIGGVASHIYAGQPASIAGHGDCLRTVREVSAVTAACMLTKRDVWSAVGGLDEALPVAYNDIDYCLKLRRLGLRILWTPQARLQHAESASRGDDKSGERRARLERDKQVMRLRWGEALYADAFYSPNLDLHAREGWLAMPPRTVPAWRKLA